MKILDFDLEGSHFIIEADVSPHPKADDEMECQWLQYDFVWCGKSRRST